MAKNVSLKIDVTKDGKIVCESVGTQGTECMDLMAFIDRIPGFNVSEVHRKAEFKDKQVQIANTQTVSH